MRGTSRRAEALAELEAAGIDGVVGDPDRVATLAPALEHVSVACLLLGSASGSPDALAALHATRLDMLLTRMIDTTVHGIVYEATGSVQASALAGGAARVRAACEDARIPYALLERAPDEPEMWLAEAVGAVDRVLSGY